MNADSLIRDLAAVSQAYKLMLDGYSEDERRRIEFYREFLTQLSDDKPAFRLAMMVVAAGVAVKSQEAQ